ncbi:TRAP transporter small permease [uncultured Oscillibacter sp.]|jgi:TRAP-type C4-dicarboxylate transport system permease small subunit|uniref:TRAP transporter small permease n=1 Tax=uncultured Oscillibacter sp. TaxID=876091 RepID=UPI00217377B4|nr:TRAP transporter small permease [uncultured Oscillibacter sp.]MCI8970300.1 TRAP transporter small permease [Oscillibacter sp.]
MKAVKLIRRVADALIVVLFAALVVLVLIQVFTRTFHMSQTWIDEISKFVFVWLTYLGGSVTVSRGMNITFDLILESVKGKTFKILFTLVNICTLIFLVAMLVLGSQNAWANRVQTSTMTNVNMGLMNLAIPIGCVLMIGAQIEYYFRTLKEREEEDAK